MANCFYSFIGGVTLLALLYKLLSSVWQIIYPHILAKRLGHVIDLKTLGKWAVVTGSTDGIGKGYAKELAKRGLNVFLISRNEERLKTTAEEIRQVALPNVEVKTLSVDFVQANAETYKTTIIDALKDLEIAVLVNNVGQSYPFPEEFLKIRGGDETFLQNLLAVNCNSTMQMTRIVLPGMIVRGKGAIINVASSMAMNPAPFLTVYSACKAFVDYFTRGIRSEYSSTGVIFQGVYPFYVATKMSGVMKRSFWVADPEEFASCALDTVGVIDFTCGSLSHDILGIGFNLIPSFLLTTGIRNACKTTRDKFLRREHKQKEEKKNE